MTTNQENPDKLSGVTSEPLVNIIFFMLKTQISIKKLQDKVFIQYSRFNIFSLLLDININFSLRFYTIHQMNNDSFLATLDDFVEITNEIVEKLKIELDWINGHRTRCNVAKTVGTAATVGGGAVVVGSLLLAPFTGNKIYEK
jgi:hypothetical protein